MNTFLTRIWYDSLSISLGWRPKLIERDWFWTIPAKDGYMQWAWFTWKVAPFTRAKLATQFDFLFLDTYCHEWHSVRDPPLVRLDVTVLLASLVIAVPGPSFRFGSIQDSLSPVSRFYLVRTSHFLFQFPNLWPPPFSKCASWFWFQNRLVALPYCEPRMFSTNISRYFCLFPPIIKLHI